MSETEIKDENINRDNLYDSKENIFSNQINSPIWEKKFVQMIEKMKTIPYVSLMHFQFINIKWITDSKDENIKKKSFESLNLHQVNHWDLVKRMMFLKATKNSLNLNKKSLNKKSKSISSLESNKRKLKSRNLKKNNLIVNKLENMFSYLFKRRRNKKVNKIKGSIKDLKEIANKRKKQLKKKSLDEKKVSSHHNIGLKKNLEKDNKDEHSKKDQSYVDREKKSLDKKNFLKSSKFKKQKTIFDLDDLSKRKKLQKLNVIMSKDEGPFMINYRTLLGIEFWSNYCGVEKWQLLAACSNILLEETEKKLNSTKKNTEKEKQKKSNKKIISIFVELKQFIKGKDEPVKAPQRVISSEEKLRLVSYKRLLNPNSDLKKTFHSNTVQDQFKKKLKKLYTSIVYLIGGNYPLKRQVGIEEVYEDILLWVLDTYQAKTRFIALLNDQIKLEIN